MTEEDHCDEAREKAGPAKDPFELEAGLIGQEHRLVPVLINFFGRKQWPVGDPRRKATRNALLWRFFSPGTLALTGGGVVGVMTLVVLIGQWREVQRQSGLFDRQNTLIYEQNQYFRQQNQNLQQQLNTQAQQHQTARRTELIAILYETKLNPDWVAPPPTSQPTPQPKKEGESPPELSPDQKTQEPAIPEPRLIPNYNARTRREALLEFIQLERRVLTAQAKKNTSGDSPQTQSAPSQEDGHLKDKKEIKPPVVNLSGALLQSVNVQKGDLRGIDFHGANLIKANLYGANLRWAYLNGANLNGANLRKTYLHRANLGEADLRGANLGEAYLWRAKLVKADLREADLREADLTETDFRKANLQDLKEWERIKNITLANIHDIQDVPEGFREWALKNGAVEEPDNEKWDQMKQKHFR